MSNVPNLFNNRTIHFFTRLVIIHVYGEFLYHTIHLAMLTGKELNVIIDVIAQSTVFA